MVTLMIEDDTSEILAQDLLAAQGIMSEVTGLFRLAIPAISAEAAVNILMFNGIACYIL